MSKKTSKFDDYFSEDSKGTDKMIIPVRCVNCGNVVSSLYRRYQAEVERLKRENPQLQSNVYVLDTKDIPQTAEKIVLDKLGLRRICCRNHMLTHIDLLHKV